MRSYVAYKYLDKWFVAPYKESIEHMTVEELKDYINHNCSMIVNDLDEVGSYEDTIIRVWSAYNDRLVYYL